MDTTTWAYFIMALTLVVPSLLVLLILRLTQNRRRKPRRR
jgi:uncharacterized membrane-anchored protein YhcB (DUF1043 family)